MTSGAPTPGAQPIPNTPSGLLEAKYDSFTAEVEFNPSERVELGAYYTYEKDAHHEPVVHDHRRQPCNNLLNYAGSDKTDTFGAQRDVPAQAGEVEALVQRHAPEGGWPDGHHGQRGGLVLQPRPHDAHSRRDRAAPRTSTTGTTPS